jgi:hypothetical protein
LFLRLLLERIRHSRGVRRSRFGRDVTHIGHSIDGPASRKADVTDYMLTDERFLLEVLIAKPSVVWPKPKIRREQPILTAAAQISLYLTWSPGYLRLTCWMSTLDVLEAKSPSPR